MIPVNYADNAVMAKVRALYGRRLMPEDYERLVNAKSLADVAAFLKNETAYGETLREVREELIHRGQLESLVRRRNLGIYMSLMKYSCNDRLFLHMYMMENEIRQLLLVVRLLNSGSMGRYIAAFPVYLSRLMSFDLFALARVKTYDDLIAIIEHSEYYNIITRFRPVSSGVNIDITACEKALLEHYYNKILTRVREDYGADMRRDLEMLINTQINFHNLSVCYRMKKFKGYSSQQIKNAMLDIKTGVNPDRAFEGILNALNEDDLYSAMQDSYLARKLRIQWDKAEEHPSVVTARARKYISYRTYRFSSKPVIIAISYMFLLEIEVNNIVNIIEGIRYSLRPEDIKNLIVF